MPQIVNIDISTTAVETPSQLQQMGAIVSQGGTTLTSGTYNSITSLSDFSAIANGSSGGVWNQVTDFFNQGNGTVYVLELGASSLIHVDLAAYILANPNLFYIYQFNLPSAYKTQILAMCNSYVSSTAKVYFTFDAYEEDAVTFAGVKSVIACTPATQPPEAAANESISAGILYNIVTANPSSTNKLAPFSFRYMYGYDAWDEIGNSSNFTRLKSENINIIGSGSSAGITDTLLFWGYTMDGKPINYWYAVDWVAINLARDLAYEIVIGSNSKTSPLIYSQQGITRLQARAVQTLSNGLNNGCLASSPAVSATAFSDYVTANPGDYSTGTYNGLSATITPIQGFESITFYLTVDFSGADVTTSTTAG